MNIRGDKMKKLAIYLLMMLSLLMVCFTLFSKIVNAETSKKVDVITDVKVQNNDGGDLTAPLGRYDTFRLNAKFALEGKNVKAGDTTEVVIASPIDIKSQDFEIKDSITGKVIANAKVDATAGKIVLTFTKFVEEKNDVSGSFFFYAGVNKDKFPNDGNAPVKVSVDNKVKFDGTVKSGTVGEGKRYTIIKSGWDNGDHKSLGFRISVNRTNEAITNAVLSDSIESPGVTYKGGSFKIYKGTWDYSTGKWQLQNKTDVTSQYTVNATDTTFTINLGNISANDHFAVEYEAVVNYDAVDREVIKNKATIVGDNKKPYDSQSKVNIQIAGGEGVGYAFGIQVHKVDESNKPLKGAKFQVIRQATGQVLGEFESNAKGDFSLKELLRDKYIIKEIQAPEGYGLAEDTIVEASEFTTPTKPVSKTIVNKKEKPAKTQATIELDKILTGRDLVDGEFSFELYEGTNKLQTVTNKSGKVSFDAISYTAEGEHTYTVKEVKGNVPGITYDTAEKQVTVQVTKDGDKLKATVVYPESKVFANTYSAPSPAKAQISASKILEGRALKDGEFSFNLLDEAGKVLQTKQNAADGSVAFDEISYSQEDAGKTFHYTIKEVIPQSQEKGMTYDQASIEVTVTVTKDDASNTIKATVAYGAKTSFTNTFVTSEIPPTPPVVEKPEAKLYTIQLHKVNGEGRALAGAVFGLFEADGSTPVANPYGEGQATATSDANGLVSFVGFEAKNYVVKELTAPEGYQLSTTSIAVSATELSAASDLVVDKGNVVNQPFTEIPPTPPVVEKPKLTLYSIQLHKVNNEGQALAGAVFGLFEADGVTPVANPYGEGQATATSDANGLVTFTGLEAKDYVVKEITAPAGYQLSEEAITVSASQLIASADQVLDRGKVVNKPFTAIPPTPPVVEKPELKLYTIQLHKVNPFYQDLAGAVFGLFEADGVTPVANPYGEGQATATSDANGLVRFVGFEAKDYVVKELTAPAGYQLSTDSITVSAAELTAATDLVVDKGNVVNQLTPPKGDTPPPSTDKPRKEIPSNPPKGKTPPPSTEKPEKEIPSNPPKGEKKEVLPSTGQSMSEGLVATGLALAVAGSTLVYKKREN